MNRKLILGLFVIVMLFVGLAARPLQDDYSEVIIVGPSQGNHRLDCTVIRPWDSSVGPGKSEYPVIVWANGWGGNNVAGETTTQDWYAEMLQGWAVDGPYIVIAANAWSAREDDVLKCLQWLVDQDNEVGGEYEDVVNTDKIGLAGHSQGAGAVVKAGDGEPNGFEITTVLAMNPYGPGWVNAGSQDGPVLVLTGANDVVTPYSWTYPVFEAIQTNGIGGLYAVHQVAGHNDLDFYKPVPMLWWQYTLNGKVGAGKEVMKILGKDPWDTQITDGME
jgi:predicted esterase